MSEATRPARGYSWAPFVKGNLVGVRHGANSVRLVSAKADAIREILLEKCPYLAGDIFAEALERYCRVESRAVMLHDWILDVIEGTIEVKSLRKGVPSTGIEAVPPYVWTEATRTDTLAQKAASDCGLDPAGHARIGQALGIAQSFGAQLARKNLSTLAERGAQIRGDRGRG